MSSHQDHILSFPFLPLSRMTFIHWKTILTYTYISIFLIFIKRCYMLSRLNFSYHSQHLPFNYALKWSEAPFNKFLSPTCSFSARPTMTTIIYCTSYILYLSYIIWIISYIVYLKSYIHYYISYFMNCISYMYIFNICIYIYIWLESALRSIF